MPLRLRRGTEADRTSITPVQGEPIYTTDTKKFYIGDGVTAGGVEFGVAGTSGTSGINGSSGTSGTGGSSGTSGSSGSSGSSGTSGSSGSSGSSGTSGPSGSSGSSGTSGTGFSTISNASDNRILTSDGTADAAVAESNLTFDGSTLTVTGNVTATSFSGSLQGSASYATNALSSSFASSASYWSGTVTSASYALNSTSASYSNQEFVNVETLSADKTLTINDKPIQILKPNSVNRNITLPTTGVPDGFKFEIWNKESYTEPYTLYVNNFHKVDPSTKTLFRYDSSITNYVIDYARNISIGGNNYGNYDTGVGVGHGAYNNYTGGVGIGGYALSNYGFAVGVGYGASSNREYGVGVGNDASSNYLYGVGIGASAIQNYSNGVGIGNNSYSNFNYAVGIGSDTTANSKGVGTVAIGAYTKAQRQNEFVTTGTNSTTNKAQSIIQKFRNKALSSASSAFQEIFTDASSGRLTIFASSIYQFRIQINAIEATGFKCKTWEITGAVKRDGSNNTTMVGGLTATPTYYVTAEDSGTSNWDVKVTADDTNEALKIEVKHDSANNVTFSATVWATETRL